MNERPIYMISVAGELAGMHPQTLRAYEQKGLVRPQRTPGGTRLYSEADVERLRIKGRGAPRIDGKGQGDVLARVRIQVPKRVNKKERELLEQLKELA